MLRLESFTGFLQVVPGCAAEVSRTVSANGSVDYMSATVVQFWGLPRRYMIYQGLLRIPLSIPSWDRGLNARRFSSHADAPVGNCCVLIKDLLPLAFALQKLFPLFPSQFTYELHFHSFLFANIPTYHLIKELSISETSHHHHILCLYFSPLVLVFSAFDVV
jgi:hypothetical protein